MERDDPAYEGQREYTPLFLRIYDPLILGFFTPVVWRCPTTRLVEGYRRHLGHHRALHPLSKPGDTTLRRRCRTGHRTSVHEDREGTRVFRSRREHNAAFGYRGCDALHRVAGVWCVTVVLQIGWSWSGSYKIPYAVSVVSASGAGRLLYRKPFDSPRGRMIWFTCADGVAPV
jgi:hypothetical protein